MSSHLDLVVTGASFVQVVVSLSVTGFLTEEQAISTSLLVFAGVGIRQ
jgi:hypothetical protein